MAVAGTGDNESTAVRERRGVRTTFDRIADHFAQTRATPWPDVRAFIDEYGGTTPAGPGLDVGCGNGRHAALLARYCDSVLAIDVSRAILMTAAEDLDSGRWETHPNRIALVQGDALFLPVADRSISLATYIATLHHLPTQETRIASLDELGRVLAPDGRGLVSAWSTVHDRFDRESGFDTTIDWTLPDGTTVPRFYHIYDPEEFDRELAASDLRVAESWVSGGNCYAEVVPA